MTKQYLALAQRIVDNGEVIHNDRTGKDCHVVINADLEYNVGAGEFPLVTTRKSFWKSAVAELLGYIRGHDNAEDFRKLGTKTWDANANDNDQWLNNPFRIGKDYMGMVYGNYAKNLPVIEPRMRLPHADPYGVDTNMKYVPDYSELEVVGSIDRLEQIYNDLKQGKDDRGEIWSFWNEGVFGIGCLRPCMYSHQFSILGDTLYLNSTQRSCDVPLGLNFNMVQVYALLAIMAQITGLKPGIAYHKIVNAHIYEDQFETMRDVQLKRTPLKPATFHLNPEIKTLEDVRTWVTVDDFFVEDYEHLGPIKYPFSV